MVGRFEDERVPERIPAGVNAQAPGLRIRRHGIKQRRLAGARIKATAAVAAREVKRRPRDDSLIVDVEEIERLSDGQPEVEGGGA